MKPHIRLHFPKPSNTRSHSAKEIVSAIKDQLESAQHHSLAGLRLPPLRLLAHQLGISKNTVQSAYEELVAQAVIESRSTQGYFVCQTQTEKPDSFFTKAHPISFQPSPFPPILKRKDKCIELSHVFIDPDLLPREKISDCFKSVLNKPGIHTFYDQQGYPPLREAIANRLKNRGITAKADDIIITTGSQQALDIVCRGLSQNSIATENPAYHIGKHLFEMNKMKTTALNIHPSQGVDFGQWEQSLSREKIDLLYLTSSFQNPTGYSYSTSDLLRILELSNKHSFGILEDDWGSDMLSFSKFRPPLRALGGENVLYMNSFTKKLLPSLRIGYLLGNKNNIESLKAAKRVSTLGNPTLIEAGLFEFLDRGYFDTHLKNLHAALDDRYQNCLELLRQLMPEEISWATPGGGPILWLQTPETLDLKKLSELMLEQGYRIDISRGCFFGKPHFSGFKIGFAYLKKEVLADGLEKLSQCIKGLLHGS